MSWLETEGEKAFREALAKEISFLNIGVISNVARDKKYETVAKGKNFLKSIAELKKLTHTSTDKFYEEFLNAATNTLHTRSKANYDLLCEYLIQYRTDLEDSSITNQATASWNLAGHSLAFTASMGAAVMGSVALHIAIWSTASLALGPWGLAALGVAIALAGLVIASYEAYKLYQNIRLSRDSQIQEITDFIAFLDPDVTPGNVNAANQPEAGPELDSYEESESESAQGCGM